MIQINITWKKLQTKNKTTTLLVENDNVENAGLIAEYFERRLAPIRSAQMTKYNPH